MPPVLAWCPGGDLASVALSLVASLKGWDSAK